jgi:hypothetical protein
VYVMHTNKMTCRKVETYVCWLEVTFVTSIYQKNYSKVLWYYREGGKTDQNHHPVVAQKNTNYWQNKWTNFFHSSRGESDSDAACILYKAGSQSS